MDNFVRALSCLIEIYILYDFYGSFFELRDKLKSNRLRYICLIIVTVALFGINSLNSAFINIIFVPLLYLLFINIFFMGNILIKFIYFSISFCLLWVCEFLFVILLKVPPRFLIDSSFTEFSTILYELFSMKLFTFILFAIAKQIPRNVKRRMNINTFLLYLLVPIASLGLMLLVYYSGIDFVDNSVVKLMMIVCSGLMTLGNILVFYGFNRYSEFMELSVQQKLIISKQEMDLKYYEQAELFNKKYKEFIHNTNHYLKAIGELASNKQDEKILQILNDLQLEFEYTKTTIYCDNPVINAILSEYRTLAEKSDIIYDVYIEPGIVIQYVTDADIIVMLGNLIDNAIAAAMKCKDNKSIVIRMFMQNEGNFCIFKIENNYCDELKFEKGRILSTKEDNELHGIGIESVKDKAKKYGGYLEIIIESDKFTSILLLPTIKS